MKVRLVNNDGSGSVGNESPISYSYSEDVTSLEPSKLDGGAGQVNVSALSVETNKAGNTRPNSKLLINNSMSLIHEDGGEVLFNVKQASTNAGVVSIIGDTIQTRLNVERTAAPHGGSGYTLFTALNYYCRLVDIYYVNGTVANFASLPATPNEYDAYITADTGKFYVRIGGSWVEKIFKLTYETGLVTQLNAIPVNFIGWKGNVWEHLKMLCAAVSISTTDNQGLEFFANGEGITFRRAKQTEVSFRNRDISNQSISIDTNQTAQRVDIFNYNTSYRTNGIVQDVSSSADNISTDAQGASFYDGMQVNAGEKLVKRFTINASLETVNQPTAVDSILPFPYTGGTGQYCISGADGIFIKATQWVGEGGRLTVALTENPNEIEVTIIAPVKNGLENISGGGAVSYEPYKIGVETTGSTDYPAIYITGTGVFYNKVQHSISTGASDQYTADQNAPAIDNPFITNNFATYTRGCAAAQVVCGPNVTLSETVDTNEPFGSTPGLIRTSENNKFRIKSVSYSAEGTNITAEPATMFSNFTSLWTGKTFNDFKATMLDPAVYPSQAMKFNEFTVVPLLEPGA
nr:MAG TPA: tail protein [Caudoviricetes sp.]